MSGDATVDIGFSALSSGEGDLTSGQRYIWDIMEALAPHDEHLNIAFPIEIGPGISLAQVLTVVQHTIERYDTLRTFFPRRADGTLYQRLDASGRAPVTLRDVSNEGDVDDETAELMTDLAGRRFDLTRAGLLRCGVVSRRAQPSRLVLCLSHMLTDAIGAWMLSRRLRGQLLPDVSGLSPETDRPWQPLDQLAVEQSDAGRLVAQQSLGYWREHLAVAPLDHGPPSADAASSPRYWHGALTSSALTLASGRLADRWKVSSNSVLLAAAGVLLGHVSGEDAPMLIMRVSNRMPGPTQHAIGHYLQAVPIGFNLTVHSVGLLVRAVHRTAITAYRYGRYQPSELTALLAELRQTRGAPVDIFNTVNCIRQPARHQGRSADAAANISESSFNWLEKREVEAIKTFLYIYPGNEVSLFADTATIPPSGIEESLRGLERMLVAADNGEDSLPAIRRLIDG